MIGDSQGSLPPTLSKSLVKQPTYTLVELPVIVLIGIPANQIGVSNWPLIRDGRLTILECFIGHFQHQSLLRIRAIGFVGGHGEKGSVELRRILAKKITTLDIDLHRMSEIPRRRTSCSTVRTDPALAGSGW